MMVLFKSSSIRILASSIIFCILIIIPQSTVAAAANLIVTPITWNVIGLDSNNVNEGPNQFPVGARVCNTGDAPATNLVGDFIWDSVNTYIDLRTGSLNQITLSSLPAGECFDLYYEVVITRDAAAYDTARQYHVAVTADGLSTISTPTPRELFVEHLISQNRNSVLDFQLDGVSIASGGSMDLVVGNTYTVRLVSDTATNGYEQIETFINFPNTIFQILNVTTTYSADGGTDPDADSKLHADGCGWDDATRDCTGTGKYGGTVVIDYEVKIISGGGTSQPLNTLIYDFSGSSYHYNKEFDASSWTANIIAANPELALVKSISSGDPYDAVGDVITYSFLVTNSGNVSLAGPVTIDDDITTNESCPAVNTVGNLDDFFDPGESITCTASYTVTQADLDAGSLTNTAAASADGTTSNQDTATATATQVPELTITKSSTTTTVTMLGQVIPYTYTVENTGNITLTNVTLSDDNTDGVPVCTPPQPATLAVGGSMSCTANHTVTQTDLDTGGNVTNVATADSDESAPDQDTLDIPITQTPELTVVKSSTMTELTAPGTVTYSYLVTNTGNVSLTGISLSDDNDNDDMDCPATTLAVGASMTCTASHTFTQAELNAGGTLDNTVTASSNEAPDDTDSLSIPITQTPALTVVKSSTTTELTAPGTVIYSYLVTNTGGVSLTGISLSDDNDNDDMDCPATTLAVGASMTCTASHTFTQAELNAGGTLDNTVTASSNEAPNDTDDLSIPITQTPALTVVKSSTTTSATTAGQVILYTYAVENTGSITLTNVTLADDNTDADPVCTPAQPATLAPGASMACAAEHTVTQAEIDGGGNVTNVATADSDESAPDQDSLDIPITTVSIGVAKRVVSVEKISTGTYEVTYEILVENFGEENLSNLQVAENLDATFPSPTVYQVLSLSSSDFSVNVPGFNGSTDTNLLGGTDTLPVSATGTITLVVEVVPASGGPFDNTAVASGEHPTAGTVTDQSQDGVDPDPNNNGDPTDDNEPTPVIFGPNLYDPPFGIKTVNDSGLPVLGWTFVWINNSNIVAVNAVAYDPIPIGTAFDATGPSSGYPLPAGLPTGSTNNGVSCTDTSLETTTQYCYYEGPTAAYPRGRIVWVGTLGPDLGVVDPNIAVNDISISFNVTVNGGITSAVNTASIDFDLNGNSDPGDPGETRVATAQARWDMEPTEVTGAVELPSTGFAPGKVTELEKPPATYSAPGELELEVPALGIRIPILGVPLEDQSWDVSWLWNQAGWLQGTAFPTMTGNSVLTSHVYNANGLPGPFVNLNSLRWGDVIIVHAFGYQYIYTVNASQFTLPNNTSALSHSEDSVITLITCSVYDEVTDSYRYRVVVQAVLVDIVQE